MKGLNEISTAKHQIEEQVINLFTYVSTLQDDDDLNAREKKYLSIAVGICIEILAKLQDF